MSSNPQAFKMTLMAMTLLGIGISSSGLAATFDFTTASALPAGWTANNVTNGSTAFSSSGLTLTTASGSYANQFIWSNDSLYATSLDTVNGTLAFSVDYTGESSNLYRIILGITTRDSLANTNNATYSTGGGANVWIQYTATTGVFGIYAAGTSTANGSFSTLTTTNIGTGADGVFSVVFKNEENGSLGITATYTPSAGGSSVVITATSLGASAGGTILADTAPTLFLMMGGATGTASATFSSLTAPSSIPEPSSAAILAGLLAAGFCLGNRRAGRKV